VGAENEAISLSRLLLVNQGALFAGVSGSIVLAPGSIALVPQLFIDVARSIAGVSPIIAINALRWMGVPANIALGVQWFIHQASSFSVAPKRVAVDMRSIGCNLIWKRSEGKVLPFS
jgi:hypothetical protein